MKELPNILFIVIDACRARNLSCYGYSKPTSPNIDELAKEGVLFEEAFSCSNGTDPSLTTIFSGKFPTSHGIISHGTSVMEGQLRRLNSSGTRFLPEILKSKGYTTLAIDWLGRWHTRGYDYYSGVSENRAVRCFKRIYRELPNPFHAFLEKFYSNYSKRKLMSAESLTNLAIKLVKANKRGRFFLFIHYWDTHTPYCPPAKYAEDFLERDKRIKVKDIIDGLPDSEYRDYMRNWMGDAVYADEIVARYDGAIAYLDHEIGRLVETLDKNKLLKDTLIVITSDHGESLTEHGVYFDHQELYDETIHVPLILKYEGLPQRKRVRGFVQHFDLVPTILEVLNINVYSDFDGRSMLPLIRDGKQIHSEVYAINPEFLRADSLIKGKRAIRTKNHKYIFAPSMEDAICVRCGRIHGGVEELYDLREDPGEKHNIVGDKPDVANELKKRLTAWINLRNSRLTLHDARCMMSDIR